MTANQIAYHRMIEEARSNRANEANVRDRNIETNRANVAQEALQDQKIKSERGNVWIRTAGSIASTALGTMGRASFKK